MCYLNVQGFLFTVNLQNIKNSSGENNYVNKLITKKTPVIMTSAFYF